MRVKRIALMVGASFPFLPGCQSMMETMNAHYQMADERVSHIAHGNAMVNFCQANNAINKNIAYAFSSVSAQVIDISVINRDLYQRVYQQQLSVLTPKSDNIPQACAVLEASLPQITQQYVALYENIARDLSLARAQEQREMTAMLANFGNNWKTPTAPIAYNYPKVSYASTQPAPSNYLINTSKGMLNCRVTSKNFVFCI